MIITCSYRGPITRLILVIHEVTIDEQARTFDVFCGTIFINFAKRTSSSSAARSVSRSLGKSVMLRRGRDGMGGISRDAGTGGRSNSELGGRPASFVIAGSIDQYVIGGKVAMNDLAFFAEKF